MLEIKIDEEEIKELYKEEVDKHLKKLDNEMLFWDTATLCKMTNLSINTIKDLFFYDPDFPKKKIGNKWIYPAKETKEFLLEWIKEQ
ncbi:group-specific protein [Tenuibacillus multivorans]|uniref:Group-specific protein n=1 Tax=Tenuibacillus multivorans TaxID=237069 RepID=A0A1G9XRS3_9BACI|nr:group-specific protein [Tenuibacillus multivorans]GEL75789.1 hypothetical protein TMU01_00240 [Tenuibacillus multivorans]SDM99420.1 hypothetical protein SAMN05216498_1081 [Tenuibacillus multivorans]